MPTRRIGAASVWLVALVLSAGTARANDVGVALGVESEVDGPYQTRNAVRGGGEVAFGPQVRLAAELSLVPDLLGAQRADSEKRARDPAHLMSDFSTMRFTAALLTRLVPLTTTTGTFTTRLVAHAGLGIAYTTDDLVAMEAEYDPYAIATQHQVHLAMFSGLGGEIRARRYGLRLRVDRVSYIETLDSLTLVSENPTSIGLELMRWY